MSATTLPRAQITIGDRARQSVGDISSLTASIRQVGLLQPVGVTASHELVFGRRRLAALDELGVTDIPVVVLATATDALGALRAELDENVERSAFTPTEAATLRTRIKAITKSQRDAAAAAAREERRSSAGTFSPAEPAPGQRPAAPADLDDVEAAPQVVAAITPAVPPVEDAADVDRSVAAITGVSVSTMQRVERIAAVRDEEPRPEVAAVADRALSAIDAGAPVKPQMDMVLAISRWPHLAHIQSDPAKVTSMAAYFDEIAATCDSEQLQVEIDTFVATFAAPENVELAAAAEAAFALNADLDRLLAGIEKRHPQTVVAAAAGALPDSARKSWEALAARLDGIAACIRSGLTESGGADD